MLSTSQWGGEGVAGGRVTLQRVADAAGVSLKTASRVVNGERYVAAATAERVRSAVRELGFRPDQSARNLARGRQVRMAGLLITTLANPRVVALAYGVEQVLRREGYSLIIASADEDPEAEQELLEEFQDRGVGSLVLVPSGDDHAHLVGAAERMNMVLAHRVVEGLDADSVAPDDVGATRRAVAELLETGHRRIGFIGDHRFIYNIEQRYAGYLAAYHDAGLEADEGLVSFGHRTAEESAEQMERLLSMEEPPTAVFTSNNLNCLGALRVLRDRGAADARIAVVGFDELPEAEYMGVPVTLLSYDQSDLGRSAANLLVQRDAGEATSPRHVTQPVTARRIAG